jgi:8-oxo-dGTP pyrophosphatase MutT (NUDIX family)
MSMQVKVHAVMWQEGNVVVHQERRQGEVYHTLPGGRVLDREHLHVALRREVEEELGIPILVGRLLYVLEVVHGHTVHDVGLLFDAQPLAPLNAGTLLIDPARAGERVLPPVLEHLAADGPMGPQSTRWLGNVWQSLQ